MLNTTRPVPLDVATAFDRASLQFKGLNPQEPGQWPLLPKVCAWIAAGLAALGLGWFLLVSGAADQLDSERRVEPTLKEDFRNKLSQP